MDSTTPTAISTQQVLKDSSTFPHGDFALISSDGVRFHINRSLLAHVSGFFRDLFSLPDTAQAYHRQGRETSLHVKETARILETFLRHIDPNKLSPDIDITTVSELLEAARFYQVATIIPWFENEVLVRRMRYGIEEQEPCFMEQHPLLVLILAYKFGLRDLTQGAIHELITCDTGLWDEDINATIDGRLILYCKRLRDKRIRLYSGLVESLTQHELSNAKRIKDHNEDTCMSCTVARAKWTYSMLDSAIRRPEWASFMHAYAEEIPPYMCGHENSWPDHKRKALEKWMNVNRHVRTGGTLPSFPEWLDRQLSENATLVSPF